MVIVILSAAVSAGNIFPQDPKMFDDHPELCKNIYSEMWSLRDALKMMSREEITDKMANPRMKRDVAKEIYNFTFIYDHDPDRFLNLNLKLDSGQMVSSMMTEGTLQNVLPINYKVTWYSFTNGSEENDNYVLIEGKRCKFQYDESSGKFGDEICWDKPSICKGWIDECIVNDDVDYLCYDTESNDGKRVFDTTVEYSSTDFGEKLYWFTHLSYFIFDDGSYVSAGRTLNVWDCYQNGLSVVCDKTNKSYDYDGDGLDASLLDTVSDGMV